MSYHIGQYGGRIGMNCASNVAGAVHNETKRVLENHLAWEDCDKQKLQPGLLKGLQSF